MAIIHTLNTVLRHHIHHQKIVFSVSAEEERALLKRFDQRVASALLQSKETLLDPEFATAEVIFREFHLTTDGAHRLVFRIDIRKVPYLPTLGDSPWWEGTSRNKAATCWSYAIPTCTCTPCLLRSLVLVFCMLVFLWSRNRFSDLLYLLLMV